MYTRSPSIFFSLCSFPRSVCLAYTRTFTSAYLTATSGQPYAVEPASICSSWPIVKQFPMQYPAEPPSISDADQAASNLDSNAIPNGEGKLSSFAIGPFKIHIVSLLLTNFFNPLPSDFFHNFAIPSYFIIHTSLEFIH